MGFLEDFGSYINHEFDITRVSPLARRALEIALEELDKGEEGSNNNGPNVLKYRRGEDTHGAWCAAFISWCFEEAAVELEVNLRFRRSNGAKKLYKNMKSVGTVIKEYKCIRPGDVICWNRGKEGSWKGHIGIVLKVEDGITYVVEGNVGKFPAVIKVFEHDLEYERVYGVIRI